MSTSTDNQRPESLEPKHLAEDLSLSNEEGMSWFGYHFDYEREVLVAVLFGDEGEVLKSFDVHLLIKEREVPS
jgi:hypothetical protein